MRGAPRFFRRLAIVTSCKRERGNDDFSHYNWVCHFCHFPEDISGSSSREVASSVSKKVGEFANGFASIFKDPALENQSVQKQMTLAQSAVTPAVLINPAKA